MTGRASRPALALILFLSAACADPHAWRRQVTAGAGVRTFFDSSGVPGGNGAHPEFRLGWNVTRVDLGLGLETSLSHSSKDRPGAAPTRLTELDAGPRYTFGGPNATVRPYLATGYSLLFARAQHPGCAVDNDLDHGVYLRAGLDWALDERWDLGLDLKLLVEEFADFGGFDLDGLDATVHLGFRF